MKELVYLYRSDIPTSDLPGTAVYSIMFYRVVLLANIDISFIHVL